MRKSFSIENVRNFAAMFLLATLTMGGTLWILWNMVDRLTLQVIDAAAGEWALLRRATLPRSTLRSPTA